MIFFASLRLCGKNLLYEKRIDCDDFGDASFGFRDGCLAGG